MNGRLPLALVALVLLVEGCSFPQPYVYREREFDRTLRTFNQDLPDLKEAVVCYNSRNTTPETVRTLAEDACGHYGKKAEFTGHRSLACPLLVPSGARFACIP